MIAKNERMSRSENYELDQLAALGLCQHGCTHIDSGRQPGDWDDADEYPLFTRHDFYAEPRQSEIHRLLFTFRKWLDFLADLRGYFSGVAKIDMVAWGWDRASARNFCSHRGAAGATCIASTHG